MSDNQSENSQHWKPWPVLEEQNSPSFLPPRFSTPSSTPTSNDPGLEAIRVLQALGYTWEAGKWKK